VTKSKRKLLLAVDGSDQAFEAVRYASRLFSPEHMEVVLFHVLTQFPESFWDIEKEPENRYEEDGICTWEMQQNIEIQKFMEQARQLFLDKGVPQDAIRVKVKTREVGIARDILHESKDNYDGVVVGRWGTSMLKDFLCGSIANKLIGRLTHTPVCVVGGTPKAGKILVAIDASVGAKRAIDHVAEVVDSSSWEVTLFHVIRNIDHKRIQKTEKIIGSIFRDATVRLETAGFNRNQLHTKIVTDASSRSSAIVVEALNGEYGTIVVGRRGLSNVEEFSMGRVSNKIIQMAREMAVWIIT
jgi:nucleotide-binding universal stress UspA family protein